YIQDSFKMYLSPQVVDQIAGDPGKLQLGGTRRELTILFTDVAGFSTISENLSAEKLVDLLNNYLGDMTDIIMANKGTVDKYEGDLIMAFWGAPIEDPDHAMDACFTALLMNDRLINMRAEFKAQGKPPFIANMDARIGLNTGDVVVGNMGSSQRFDYTVMGDHVNLASRLEGANKPYGTHIMISEFTYAKVKDHIEVRELDTIRVVGRDEPVTIYEVLAKTGEVDEKMGEIASLYQSAMEVYKDRGWNEAQEKFLKILTIDPNDGPSKTYVGRCEKYSVEPPLAEWDFVETMTEK
ncbi:MAG: adenylate/guanylate cyclase domain-containing protein, partial [Candidatus Latescibacteria bacterium]|nr:adenylate/guanylate cyclase domain-containing protein [Candidatus Latescibacterota bacterium]